jgi:hypothetical protein
MLYAMESDLQKRFEKMSAFGIITNLKAVFAPQARAERYEASDLFFSSKMEEHNSVSEHVFKMSGYVQRLNALKSQISDELAIDRMLQSLPLAIRDLSCTITCKKCQNPCLSCLLCSRLLMSKSRGTLC